MSDILKSGLDAFFPPRRSVKYLPTKLFIAINTIEVGVDIFSLILKSRLRIEKEQISTPLPVTPEKIPPRKPVKTKLTACQVPKF